ncbi:MAG: S41 family peptidase [Salinivirgaceae bacterium]|jgi:hypothetical protein|nr:S41 family peptidase [Bacteroidales bacterium]
MKQKIQLLFIFSFFLIGCEKVFMPETKSDNISVFEEVYEVAKANYVFFEYKQINWDSIYLEFQPEITNDMSEEDFFIVLSAFVNKLEDTHTRIIWNNKSIGYDFTNNANANFDKELLFEKYLKDDYLTAGVVLYKKLNDVGYVYIPNFWYGNEHEKFNDILNYFRDTKGIIVDIRDNGGGHNMSGMEIARHFVTKKTLVAKWYYKTGTSYNSFSEKYESYIEPSNETIYTNNVMLLVNREVYSAANDFTNTMNQIPSVTLIGDTTGGGGGIPRMYILQNGWKINISDTYSTDPFDFNVEHGIAPDIFIEMDTLNTEVDEIIERAIQELNK